MPTSLMTIFERFPRENPQNSEHPQKIPLRLIYWIVMLNVFVVIALSSTLVHIKSFTETEQSLYVDQHLQCEPIHFYHFYQQIQFLGSFHKSLNQSNKKYYRHPCTNLYNETKRARKKGIYFIYSTV